MDRIVGFNSGAFIICENRCYIALKSYNVCKTESDGFSNEVEVAVRAPEVWSIEPNHGPAGGATTVIVKGAGFAPLGVKVLIGGERARNVVVVDENPTAVIRFAPGPFAPAPAERAAAVSAGPLHGSDVEPGAILMTQIDELIRNPIPDSFQSVAGIAEPEFEDENLMDFIVPDVEDDGDICQTSKNKGALSC